MSPLLRKPNAYNRPLDATAHDLQHYWATPRKRTVRVKQVLPLGKYWSVLLVRADKDKR